MWGMKSRIRPGLGPRRIRLQGPDRQSVGREDNVRDAYFRRRRAQAAVPIRPDDTRRSVMGSGA
jgi:hypothetical protein